MSFQEELRRNKDRLKAVETTVTTATGKKVSTIDLESGYLLVAGLGAT